MTLLKIEREKRNALLCKIYNETKDIDLTLKRFNSQSPIKIWCGYCGEYHKYEIPSKISLVYILKYIGIISHPQAKEIILKYEKEKRKNRSFHTYQANKNCEKKVCEICGKTDNLEIHHKIPVYCGGISNPDNLKVLCKDCHKDIHRSGQAPLVKRPVDLIPMTRQMKRKLNRKGT